MVFVEKHVGEKNEYASNLWMVSRDGPSAGWGDARQFTAGGKDTHPRWSPDGARIAFATSFGERNRFARHGLATVDVSSGLVRDLGSVDGTFLEAPGDHAWSPDGRDLLVTAAAGVSTRLLRIAPDGVTVLSYSSAPGTAALARVARDAGLVAYLASETCRETGRIFSVGGGYIARVAILEGEGATFDDSFSPDDVAAKWGEIMQVGPGATEFTHGVMEQTGKIVQALGIDLPS